MDSCESFLKSYCFDVVVPVASLEFLYFFFKFFVFIDHIYIYICIHFIFFFTQGGLNLTYFISLISDLPLVFS